MKEAKCEIYRDLNGGREKRNEIGAVGGGEGKAVEGERERKGRN